MSYYEELQEANIYELTEKAQEILNRIRDRGDGTIELNEFVCLQEIIDAINNRAEGEIVNE